MAKTPTTPEMTVLVTGFGPFPGVPTNASEMLARAVDGAVFGRWRVVGRVVDTSWQRAWPQLQAAEEAVRPAALVMFGVAPRRQPEIELVARNLSELRGDCDGVLPPSEVLEAGPSTLPTHLPAAELGCGVSQDAGRYLCNALFYRSQLHLTRVPRRGFVHIPLDGLWPGLRLLGRLLRWWGDDRVA